MASQAPAHVLIVTVTKAEAEAVFETFGRDRGANSIDGRVYFDLGTVNGARVRMTRSAVGADGFGASREVVRHGISAVSPVAVVALGHAFGMHEGHQRTGDVLVARDIRWYGIDRANDSKDETLVMRGRWSASPWLIDHLRSAELSWQGPRVYHGTVLCVDQMVDRPDLREKLRAKEESAIGGEREGAGVYGACFEEDVDCILVKGICDWADGRWGNEDHRSLAAKNAAAFVAHAIRFAAIDWERRRRVAAHPSVPQEVSTSNVAMFSPTRPTSDKPCASESVGSGSDDGTTDRVHDSGQPVALITNDGGAMDLAFGRTVQVPGATEALPVPGATEALPGKSREVQVEEPAPLRAVREPDPESSASEIGRTKCDISSKKDDDTRVSTSEATIPLALLLAPDSRREQRVLIMRGGGMKGLALIGALTELFPLYDFKAFVGTSAGAITATLLGAGYLPAELREVLVETTFTEFLDAPLPIAFFNLIRHGYLYPGDKVHRWIDDRLRAKVDRAGEISLTDLNNRVVLFAAEPKLGSITFDSRGKNCHVPAATAARQSMSIPFLFRAWSMSEPGRPVYDGGVVKNFPIIATIQDLKFDAKDVLALYLGTKSTDFSSREHWPKVLATLAHLLRI
jgi:nucleoside phosphorylase